MNHNARKKIKQKTIKQHQSIEDKKSFQHLKDNQRLIDDVKLSKGRQSKVNISRKLISKQMLSKNRQVTKNTHERVLASETSFHVMSFHGKMLRGQEKCRRVYLLYHDKAILSENRWITMRDRAHTSARQRTEIRDISRSSYSIVLHNSKIRKISLSKHTATPCVPRVHPPPPPSATIRHHSPPYAIRLHRGAHRINR